MQNGQEERKVYKIPHSIYHPESIKDMEKYCIERDVVIRKCYGYEGPHCPMTCSYATKRENEDFERGIK